LTPFSYRGATDTGNRTFGQCKWVEFSASGAAAINPDSLPLPMILHKFEKTAQALFHLFIYPNGPAVLT
jgi:hypothetical protein